MCGYFSHQNRQSPYLTKSIVLFPSFYCLLAVTNCGLEGVDLWKPCQIYPISSQFYPKRIVFLSILCQCPLTKSTVLFPFFFCLPTVTNCGLEMKVGRVAHLKNILIFFRNENFVCLKLWTDIVRMMLIMISNVGSFSWWPIIHGMMMIRNVQCLDHFLDGLLYMGGRFPRSRLSNRLTDWDAMAKATAT